MPCVVREQCEYCRKWDWFLLINSGRYICNSCKQKRKELEMEALSKAVKGE